MKNRMMVACASAAMLLPSMVAAQLSTAVSSTTVKSTVTAPVVFPPEQRHAFEASLTGVANTADMSVTAPAVALTWTALPGTTYKVLRYASLTTAPMLLTPPETGPRYVAELLPGHDFYFRIVALASGAPVDTSMAYHIAVPALVRNTSGAPSQSDIGTFPFTCSASVPATLALSWTRKPNIDDFTVTVRPTGGTTGPAVVNTTTTTTSLSQTGLPAGPWRIDITGNYVMHDYPAPGQTTRAPAQVASANITLPVSSSTGCSPTH